MSVHAWECQVNLQKDLAHSWRPLPKWWEMGLLVQIVKHYMYNIYHISSFPKAPAVSMGRISAAAAASGLEGGAVQQAARFSERNAERDAHRFFERWGLKLNVAMSYVEVSDGKKILQVPVLKPSAYIKCLLSRWPTLLFGGSGLKDAKKKCAVFWRGLYESQPSLEVFSQFKPEQLETLIPLCLHGDEGTGSKKQPISIQCFETVFGKQELESDQKSKRARFQDCNQSCGPEHRARGSCCKVPSHWTKVCANPGFQLQEADFEELSLQWHATRGHSFLARYLTFVIPTNWIDKGPWVLDGVQAAIAEDLRGLFYDGLDVHGVKYHAAVVGLKGDAKWHVRQGRFERSYMRLGQIRSYPICPYCNAGEEEYPFEETGDCPRWSETVGKSVPWSNPGAYESMPFDKALPGVKYRRDLPTHSKLG